MLRLTLKKINFKSQHLPYTYDFLIEIIFDIYTPPAGNRTRDPGLTTLNASIGLAFKVALYSNLNGGLVAKHGVATHA